MMKINKFHRLSRIFALCLAIALVVSLSFVPQAKAATATATATGLSITDNNPITVQLNGPAGFNINVPSTATRYIVVSSNTKLRTQIVPVNSMLQSYISYDSVAPRISSRIAWHFVPNNDYTMTVYPESTPATVTISMSTSGSDGSWIYNENTPSFTEKNELLGGQQEIFNWANQVQPYGTYKITVTTNISNLSATFADNDGISPDQRDFVTFPQFTSTDSSSYTFTSKKIYYTGPTQTAYSLLLYNPNSSNTGGYYSITIQRVA